ncbi:MAG TPA: threonine/serine exporter family protein [Candidatus Saccharimonadales bacterium]|nr:threonine/serine exporter family protein [Candidatus Saccharimonadales bacterium]
MKWWPKLRTKKYLEELETVNTAFAQFEKFGETLTPNLRALRLTMTVSDILLSMGVSSNSVVSKALDITDSYCKKPVHIDVNSNLLMLSQLRGIEKEPLTLIRPVSPRNVNNMTIQSIQHMIYKIRTGVYDLERAEIELEKIINHPRTYPWWVVTIGNAGIAAGVTLMFTQSWRVVLTTFVIGLMVDRILASLAKHAVPSFFRQVIASAAVTLAAALIFLSARLGVDFFVGMNPTLIVIGGIFMLLAGLVIVGAIQDAIEEYYLTATAQLLKVGMLTIGIVIGILIGLYTARKLGIGIAVSPDPLTLNGLQFQIIGAGIAAAAYALSTQTYVRAITLAALTGGGALFITFFASEWGISVIPASGVAAILVGLIASFFSRFWRTPSAGIIAAGIIPLVPGLALYTGLMQLINYPPGDLLFNRGIGTLFTALATALAIAAGASFGSLIGRPLHQKITHSRNFTPFVKFMRRQLKTGRRTKNHPTDYQVE